MKRAVTAVAAAIALVTHLVPVSAVESGPRRESVRVLITEDRWTPLTVAVKGSYRITSIPDGRVLRQGKGLPKSRIQTTRSGLRFNEQDLAFKGLRITPEKDGDLYLEGRRFRGWVEIRRAANGGLYAINTLDLEKYLYGVLHHEVGSWWPSEALKAQAVAARTYALYQVRVSRSREFDVHSGTRSQVYGGSTNERRRTNAAVDATSGQVLSFQGRVFPAYFHATCAGRTAGASELWAIDLKPIGGGVECGYCRYSPHFNWKSTIPLSQIEESLSQHDRKVGRLLSIEPLTRTPSGRIGRIRFTGTEGEAEVAAKDLRVWIGGDKVRSTAFQIAIKDDRAVFEGRGWGHGVGLCQWGALGQSLTGRQYRQMLDLYYPGATITDYRSVELEAVSRL
ncbi:MAG: hypothetical protein MOGMAGMI_01114 [Candidatus Omnitrophica bacterium]|nr:hypothetical protein [Candidatus Omnitrophota bacterium]